MGIERNRRIDRVTAEKLLAGDPTVTGDVADLLAAAASPAHVGDVAGEQAAVAMFRTTRLGLDHQPRSRSMLRSTVAKLLTTKIAAVLLAVLGAGGVAVAASSGALPNPLHGHTILGRGHASGAPSPTPPGHASPSPHPSPATSSSATLRGLCHAYAAQISAGHTTILDNSAFNPLIMAAGGKTDVSDYCTALLASPSSTAAPAGHPGNGPTSHPTGKPSTHPAAKPSGHTTAKPSTHPGAAPSSHPSH